MAIATSAALMGGAALAGSAFQFAKGQKQEKEAREALNEFERQELQNIYKDMPISLLGSNIRREDQSQMTSNLVQSAQGTGIRGVMGMLPRIQASNTKANRDNMLDVDNQVMKRAYSIAGDEGRIQGMQEARDNADLAGIGQQLAVGQQNTMAGIGGAFNAIGLAGSGVEGTIGESDGSTGSEGRWTPPTIPAMNTGQIIQTPMPAPTASYMPGVTQSQDYQNYMRYMQEEELRNSVFPKF